MCSNAIQYIFFSNWRCYNCDIFIGFLVWLDSNPISSSTIWTILFGSLIVGSFLMLLVMKCLVFIIFLLVIRTHLSQLQITGALQFIVIINLIFFSETMCRLASLWTLGHRPPASNALDVLLTINNENSSNHRSDYWGIRVKLHAFSGY